MLEVIRCAVERRDIVQRVRSAGRVLHDEFAVMGELFYYETGGLAFY